MPPGDEGTRFSAPWDAGTDADSGTCPGPSADATFHGSSIFPKCQHSTAASKEGKYWEANFQKAILCF